MKRAIIIAAVLAVIYLPVKAAHAAGTAAGTNITNIATGEYTFNGSDVATDSNITLDIVAEIIDVTVTWQDPPNIQASPGDTGKVATFRVTNPGNGTEVFALFVNAAAAGDDFDPVLAGIYLDTNDSGAYDAGTDTLYTPGINDPSLSAGGFKTVFVLCDIPAGIANGTTGDVHLTATSKTGTGAAGTLFAGQGDGGGDAVIGLTGGTATAIATYQVPDAGVTVPVVKSAVVIDQAGGDRAVSGSTIRYTLSVTAAGSGTAAGVVITDPIPADTTYIAGTLKLNGMALTDENDADAGDVGETTAGTVTVSLGDLTSASPPQEITFDVKIN